MPYVYLTNALAFVLFDNIDVFGIFIIFIQLKTRVFKFYLIYLRNSNELFYKSIFVKNNWFFIFLNINENFDISRR